MTFEMAASALKGVSADKGEYETTAAYEARMSAARSALPSTIIISSRLDPEYLKYNADAGSLEVTSYALRNINTDYSSVFGYGTPYYDKIKYSSYDNIDWVVSQTESKTGSYIASNAFGAHVRVDKIFRMDEAIFEGEADFGTDFWLPADKDAKLGSIPMSVDEAKQFKATGKAAVVVEPKWPFYAEGIKHWEPNFESRIDVTNPVRVIVADIQCGLLLSAANKVVGAYSTR